MRAMCNSGEEICWLQKVAPAVFHGQSMIAKIETEAEFSTLEVHVLRSRNGADTRWIAYNVLSGQFLDDVCGAVYGVGSLQRISAGYLGDYRALETDIVSQRRIAGYLDRETVEIGAGWPTWTGMWSCWKSGRVWSVLQFSRGSVLALPLTWCIWDPWGNSSLTQAYLMSFRGWKMKSSLFAKLDLFQLWTAMPLFVTLGTIYQEK